MNESVVTSDFAEFGYRERVLAANLLNAWNKDGLPYMFDDNEVTICMNKNSGYVFLCNSEYQVAMMNGDKLEMWHNLPYSGIEGFADDILAENKLEDLNSEDLEYLKYARIISEEQYEEVLAGEEEGE